VKDVPWNAVDRVGTGLFILEYTGAKPTSTN